MLSRLESRYYHCSNMLDLYEKIVAFRKQGLDLVLVTATEKMGEGPVEVGKKMLVTPTGDSFGTVGGGALERYAQLKCQEVLKARTHMGETYLLDKGKVAPETKTLPMVCGGRVTLFYEFIGVRNYIYIFGAGHVGAALVKVLTPLNFHLTVIDERQDVIEGFQGGNVKVFSKFTDYIENNGIKDDSYVVVCTPSHLHDYHVINKIIERKFTPRYVGMLCSAEKLKDYLHETYQTFGDDIDLSYFYSPIGLELGGGSPEDIAISIAAEILVIHHRIQGQRHMREKLNGTHRYWQD